jgi:hypothetical protein
MTTPTFPDIEQIYLNTYNDADYAASVGDIFMLELLSLKEIYCSENGVIQACINGQTDVIKYLHSRDRLLGKEWLIDFAAGYGSFHIVLFLESLNMEHSSFGMFLACVTRCQFMIRYLFFKNVVPDRDTIDYVYNYAPEHIQKFFKERNFYK